MPDGRKFTRYDWMGIISIVVGVAVIICFSVSNYRRDREIEALRIHVESHSHQLDAIDGRTSVILNEMRGQALIVLPTPKFSANDTKATILEKAGILAAENMELRRKLGQVPTTRP